jgi:hypothetical protein
MDRRILLKNGKMGRWNIGMMREEKILNPIFQHSIIPISQRSEI